MENSPKEKKKGQCLIDYEIKENRGQTPVFRYF